MSYGDEENKVRKPGTWRLTTTEERERERDELAYRLINIIEMKRKIGWSDSAMYISMFNSVEKGYDLTSKQIDIINNTFEVLFVNDKIRCTIDDIYEIKRSHQPPLSNPLIEEMLEKQNNSITEQDEN